MKALLLTSVCLCTLALAQTDEKAKVAPAKEAPAKKAPAKADAGVAAPAPAADAGAKAGNKVEPAPAADAGVKAESKVEPAKGAKEAPAAVPAPDKKTVKLWKSKCGSCHGEDGKGATEKGKKMKVDDMTAAAWQTSHSDAELKNGILKGVKDEKDGVKREMDPYEADLSAEQVEALVKYVRFVGAPK